ncbi:hypothetical protein B7463_g7063, partial [Scytalidium lignicola]
MAQSFFTYNITRPYPYKWFTWVTIIGAIGLAILFSLINYAAYGYELSVHYTVNPNQTFAITPKFLNTWPLQYENKVSASCQPVTIPIGAQDCEISFVQIELLAEDRTAEQFGWCQWGPSISATAVCSLKNSDPVTMINVTTNYDLLPPTIGNGQQSRLLTLDPVGKASLWWGASLISAYWMMLSGQMQTNRSAGSNIRKGSINLQQSQETNISSQSFFSLNYHFMSEISPPTDITITANSSVTPAQLLAGNGTNPPANIWNLVDIYAKSFYSTVLADLGQTSANTKPNILTESHRELLQNYTSVFENMPARCNAANGPATLSFEDESRRTKFGPLQLKNSTIVQQYLCEIPKQKSTGIVVVAILSADLVFLQTAWACFTWLTTSVLVKKDKTAMFCASATKNSEKEKGENENQDYHLEHIDPSKIALLQERIGNNPKAMSR